MQYGNSNVAAFDDILAAASCNCRVGIEFGNKNT